MGVVAVWILADHDRPWPITDGRDPHSIHVVPEGTAPSPVSTSRDGTISRSRDRFGFLFCYTYTLGKRDIWFVIGWLDFTCAKVERIGPVMERTYHPFCAFDPVSHVSVLVGFSFLVSRFSLFSSGGITLSLWYRAYIWLVKCSIEIVSWGNISTLHIARTSLSF